MKIYICKMLICSFIICIISFVQPVYAGGGYVTGRVLKTDGEPIAGVDIAVLKFDPYEFRNTKSTLDGMYILKDLPPGTYRLVASFKGYSSSEKTSISVSAAKVTENINFTLIKFGSICGRVLENDSVTPISGAVVSANSQMRFLGKVVTNVDGNYTIEELLPSIYTISVSAMGYATQEQNISLKEGEDIQSVDVLLPKGAGISGKVIQTDGMLPIPNALVFAFSPTGDYGDAVTSEDGVYTITGLTGGNYTVVVDVEGFILNSIENVVASKGHTTLDLDLYLERY